MNGKRALALAVVLVAGLAAGLVFAATRGDTQSADEADRASRFRVDLGGANRFVVGKEMPKRLLVARLSGDTTYDLRAANDEADVRIELGMGDATVILPEDAGVRVYGVRDGFGRWDAPGFSEDGDCLVNAKYGRASKNIDVRLFRGQGVVSLVTSDAVASR